MLEYGKEIRKAACYKYLLTIKCQDRVTAE